MLRIFQNIRQKLLKESNFKRYLLYAVGEILLVMVGILLALQVNNWNEENKIDRANDKLLQALEEDLKKNITEMNDFIRIGQKKDSLINLVREKRVNKASYEKEGGLLYLLSHVRNDLVHDNLEKVLQKEELFSDQHSRLFSFLKEYFRSYERVQDYDQVMISMIGEFVNNMAKHHEWYGSSGSSFRESFIDYQLNDALYPGRLRQYGDLLDAVVSFVVRLRNFSLVILGQTKEIREGYDRDKLENLYQELKFNPLPALTCDQGIIDLAEEVLSHAHQFHVYNTTNQPVQLINKNKDGKELSRIELQPQEIKLVQPQGLLLERQENNNCVQLYRIAKNGFLIL